MLAATRPEGSNCSNDAFHVELRFLRIRCSHLPTFQSFFWLFFIHVVGSQRLSYSLHKLKYVDVNAGGGWYGSALQAAGEEGHLKVFQLLLE